MDRFRNHRLVVVAAILLLNSTADHLKAQETTLKGHAGPVMMAAFASDNGRVVTASSDQTAKLWDVETAAELQSFTQHTGPLYCLAVSSDGRTLVTGAQDNTLRVWDLPLSHPIRKITEPGPAVTDITFGPDGKSLLAGAVDHSVRLFGLATTTPIGAIPVPVQRPGHAVEVLATAYRNDGTMFATSDANGHVFVWSPDLDQPLARLNGHAGKVTAIVMPNSDQRLATAGDDGLIRVWTLPQTAPKQLLASDAAGRRIAVIPGQQIALYLLANGGCQLINLQTGEVQREFLQTEGETTQIAVAPNQTWFARARCDGQAQLLNPGDGNIIGLVGGHDGAISDVAACQDGQRFITVGRDGTARLWKQPVSAVSMAGHTGIVHSLASAGSGTWSLTISDDMTTRRWDAAGGLVAQFANHTQPLRAVAIRDDDASFATGDAEGTVWIWDAASGAAQSVVTAHAGAITSLEFSADRSSLITAGIDGTIRSWTLPLPAQKLVDGEEPPKPAWEFKSPDSTAVTQLARLSQEEGLLAITTEGTSILRVGWDGTAGNAIPSPGGVLKGLNVAASQAAFLTTGDAGQIHVFEPNGTLRKSLPPITGLTSARLNRDGTMAVVCTAQPFVQIVNIASGRVQEQLATPFAVSDADWTGEDQRSIVCIRAANDAVLVQSSLLKLWDGIPGGATSVTVSPDQQSVFCGSADGSIRQWNLADKNPASVDPVRISEGHTGTVTDLAVSPNGQVLCSASADKTLRIWNIADGAIVHTLTHPQSVLSASISPDSTRAVTGSIDGIERLWDLKTGNLLESFANHAPDSPVSCVRYLSDGQTIVSTGDDKLLISARPAITLAVAVHAGPIRCMVPYTTGAQVISVGEDAKVLLTNLTNGNMDREFTVGNEKPTAVSARVDGQRVAAGCESGEVLIWNANDGTKTLLSLNVKSAVRSLAWSPDNRKLAVATTDNMVHVFAPSMQGVQPAVELTLHQQFPVSSPVNRLLFSIDSRSVWTALADGQIEEWAYAGSEQRRQFSHGGPVYGVAVTHDGSTVVSCSADQTVRVWDTTTGQQKFQLSGHVGPVHAVAMSPDETFAVSSGADGTLRLWDIVGGRQLKQLITYDATMYSLAVHPQGALIAAAGADRKVHLLDMITGTEQATMTGHTDYLHCVTFSPDGSTLMSYGYAGQLRLWKTADGTLASETRIGRVGNSAQFSPDGNGIVIANGDATATVFPTNPAAP